MTSLWRHRKFWRNQSKYSQFWYYCNCSISVVKYHSAIKSRLLQLVARRRKRWIFHFFSIASASRISFLFFFLSYIDNISIDSFKLMNSVSRDRQRSFAISRMMAPRSKSYSFLGGANFDSFSITFSISFVAASLIFIFSFAFKKLNYDHAYSQNIRSYDS